MTALATFDFTGAVVVVTGAGSGIGRATALKFASSGASVVLADITEDAGATVAREIAQAGGKAHFQRTDVRQAEDCEALAAAAVSRFGRLDAAFNNAGIINRLMPAASYGAVDWQRLIDVNLTGVFNCMTAQLRVMRESGGAIVNNASIMGLIGGRGAMAYSASKHGVIGMTRSAALDHGRHGIRINAICPGFVATPMTGDAFAEKATNAAVQRTAVNRLGKPEEIADAVLWLCSDAASFVSGAAIAVDGGFTAG